MNADQEIVKVYPSLANPLLHCLALSLACAFAGCASGEIHQQILLARDAQITLGSARPLTMKKGEVFDLGSEPALVESKGQISVLLLPPSENGGSGKVTVGLKPGTLDDSRASTTAANDLIISVEAVEALISEGKAQEAETKLRGLEAKYPKVAALKFLRARCFFARGEKIQGRALFEEAQRDFPDFGVGKEFIDSASPRRAPASGNK